MICFINSHRSSPWQEFMRIKILSLVSVIGALLFTSNVAMGQERLLDSASHSADSLRASHEFKEAQKAEDAASIRELKKDRAETRTKAREAQRVEREANNAAMESRNAYRAEKKAQKARIKADAQAKKASRARDRSDQN